MSLSTSEDENIDLSNLSLFGVCIHLELICLLFACKSTAWKPPVEIAIR